MNYKILSINLVILSKQKNIYTFFFDNKFQMFYNYFCFASAKNNLSRYICFFINFNRCLIKKSFFIEDKIHWYSLNIKGLVFYFINVKYKIDWISYIIKSNTPSIPNYNSSFNIILKYKLSLQFTIYICFYFLNIYLINTINYLRKWKINFKYIDIQMVF